VIKLINRTDKYAAFKLKTTAPKRYGVRPKEGIVPPHSTERIEGVFIVEGINLVHSQYFETIGRNS